MEEKIRENKSPWHSGELPSCAASRMGLILGGVESQRKSPAFVRAFSFLWLFAFWAFFSLNSPLLPNFPHATPQSAESPITGFKSLKRFQILWGFSQYEKCVSRLERYAVIGMRRYRLPAVIGRTAHAENGRSR
jgi:hypothetical protein